MQVDSEGFVAAVRDLYVQHPCRVSSLAFWKTAHLCRQSDTYCFTNKGYTYLYAVRDQRLEFYWSDDRRQFLLTPGEIKAFEFLVLHADFYRPIADRLEGYQVSESHPLLYDFAFDQEVEASNEFYAAPFDFAREAEYRTAAKMLNRCYGTDRHRAAELAGWRELPAFDASLWLWVKRRASKEAVGLGISTYQACVRECDLDWIQVLPAYRGRGLGRLLVGETIRRALPKSDIIRVTGMADGFYRNCGFAGSERWYVIAKA